MRGANKRLRFRAWSGEIAFNIIISAKADICWNAAVFAAFFFPDAGKNSKSCVSVKKNLKSS